MDSSRTSMHALVSLCALLCTVNLAKCIGQVIWAVNSGGDAHTDINGIRYQKDMLSTGIPSDYGKNTIIQRVIPQDLILYQTERYHYASFSYNIPVTEDGDYVLVLKFSEVYFTAPNQKVFSVVLNGQHTVVDTLDIYSKVGRGVAHDEFIPFSIKDGKLMVTGESSHIEDSLEVEFVKGAYDNPKVNALYIMKGRIDDVPKLAPIPGLQKKLDEAMDDEDEVDDVKTSSQKPRRASEPKVTDPYSSEDSSSMMLPVVIAICAFIPILFCLCRL